MQNLFMKMIKCFKKFMYKNCINANSVKTQAGLASACMAVLHFI